MPVIGNIATEKMVDLHVHIFSEHADPDRRDGREDHTAAFFEYTLGTYLTMLDADFPEAETHEITYVQTNFNFYNHGWTKMMEIPVDEIEAHYRRYKEFLERRGTNIAEPLGGFRTIDIPDAPVTLDRLNNPNHPHTENGLANDVYVEDGSGEVRVGGTDEPEDVDVSAAPGMQGIDHTDERAV